MNRIKITDEIFVTFNIDGDSVVSYQTVDRAWKHARVRRREDRTWLINIPTLEAWKYSIRDSDEIEAKYQGWILENVTN
jgi:hypothetical protein